MHSRGKNAGVSNARNMGINAAQGMYIAVLDADDSWFQNKLESMAKVIESKPTIDLFWHWERQYRKRGVLIEKYRQIDNDKAYSDFLYKGNCISTTAVCVKKETIKKVNGFDTRFHAGEEDYDCWLRIARAGGTFYLVPQGLGVWKENEGSLSSQSVKHFEGVINMLRENYDYLKDNGEDPVFIEKMWNKKQGEMYCFLGRTLSIFGDRKSAIKYYKMSISIYPWFYKTYGGIVMAILGI